MAQRKAEVRRLKATAARIRERRKKSQNEERKMGAPIELRSMAPRAHVARGSNYASY